ncbi:uncharacterized protein LOC142174301 [Nicotiana tabacum]|uniref:Uncharacterized protein LOC142174301 n=1 Tax=Nicotiana tabacum TaxID=4097 RepID=A0AC58TG31_TOBAC
MAPKLEDPGAFTIHCTIGNAEFFEALCELGANFFILDREVDYEVPIILGRPFLSMGKALVDVKVGELTFRVGDKKVVFHVCKSMRQPYSNEDISGATKEREGYWMDIGRYSRDIPRILHEKD